MTCRCGPSFVLLLQATLGSEGLAAGRDETNPVLQVLWKLGTLNLYGTNHKFTSVQLYCRVYYHTMKHLCSGSLSLPTRHTSQTYIKPLGTYVDCVYTMRTYKYKHDTVPMMAMISNNVDDFGINVDDLLQCVTLLTVENIVESIT